MCIYLKNNPAKFHPDPIWNDGALDFLEERHSNKNSKKKNKINSDMGSVPDPELECDCCDLVEFAQSHSGFM